MRSNITVNLLKKLKPESKDYFVRSSNLLGFGVKVTSLGIINFIAECKHEGTNYRKTIGRYPVMSIGEAESEARAFLNLVYTGQYSEEKKRQHTFRQLFQDYTKTVMLKPATLKNYQHVILFYLHDWLSLPVVSIDKNLVENRFYLIRDQGIKGGKPTYSQATKTMRILSALMNYAKADGIITDNPVDILRQKRIDRSIIKRDTYLTVEQARELINLTRMDNHPMTLAVNLMLLTGMRKTEALSLRWKDVQSINGIECITISDTKNGRQHFLPVTEPISAILERAKTNQLSYIFPSPDKPGQYFHDERHTMKRLSRILGVDFKCHDLRRTFATRAMEVGVDYLTVKRLLNHKSNDITARYIQWNSKANLEAMRNALEKVKY